MSLVGAGLSMRDRAREDIYGIIRRTPGLTRAQIARTTGMSRSAVAHSVGRLVREGRITEADPQAPGTGAGSGRPASQLFPAFSASPVAGIDFGHRHILVAVADTLGNEIASELRECNVDLDARGAMDSAAEMLGRIMRDSDVIALGSVVAGIPGPIDSDGGVVRSPTILSGWVGLNPADELSSRLNLPVLVDNDAVLGAFGEHVAGVGRGHDNMLYVKVSDGIGAALIVNGELYRGATGLAGEVGHTRLDYSAELCRCGSRGCLEAVISTGSILRQLEHTHPGVPIATIDDLPFEDEVTERVFDEAGRTIGRVLSDLCNLVNPSLIVIGGKLGTAHPALVNGIRSAVDRYAQPATAASLEVVTAQHGCRAELKGAIHRGAWLARR